MIGLRLVWRAEALGQRPDDPLCVYRDGKGATCYLTGASVTDYFRFVTRLVHPSITDEELQLISTHSIRVTACVLLAEAGKEGWYIKLRLRWLSDCYEVYIRNTGRIAMAHNDALHEVNERLAAVAISSVNLPDSFVETGVLDPVLYQLEDED